VTVTTATWATVVVRVGADDADLVSGLFWDAGVAGVEERPTDDAEVIELRAGVPAGLVDSVVTAVSSPTVGTVVVVEPVADDGLDCWREFARPWRAGSRIVVVPSWQEPPSWTGPDDIVLSIDPGRAFGSGAHPTTRMCLAELERLVEPDSAVADIGSGSGVLAVAAARLGAALVVAVDIDPEAVRATAENADRNGVRGVVTTSDTPAEQLEAGAYDLVVANIAAGTLAQLAPALVRVVADDGTIVVSGVLDEQVGPVLAAFEAEGLGLAGTVADDDWRTLLVRRP
jgi:ribosomal protein L11 methyltransferase